MNARHKAGALALAAALFSIATLASAAHAAGRPAQSEPQRRPQGPAAGPAIKLPRGEGAADERTPAPGARGVIAREPPAPQKWEYCVINGFKDHQKGLGLSSPLTPSAYVRYLPGGSEEIEGATEDEAVNNAFAKLGDEGWELAGVRTNLSLSDGTGTSSTIYYFKRPKRED
jgi:hypothetical protein